MPVYDYLDLTAQRLPERVAVTDGCSAITFGDLSTLSHHLGCFLGELGVAREERDRLR